MSHITAALNPRSVLMATDFSEASEKALRHSLAIARLYGSRFCLAHVISSLGLLWQVPMQSPLVRRQYCGRPQL